jgi:2-methylisocitrate lyase-like PEP mutase family enzyme
MLKHRNAALTVVHAAVRNPPGPSDITIYDPVMTSLRDTFRALHQEGTFVMPNPWDRGSARILQEAGFPALATTSAGYARSIGKNDQELTRDDLLANVADLAAFIAVPLNVDSERLFADDPGGIAETVRMLAAAGASGCSIEDYNPAISRIDPTERATEAVAEAVAACSEHGLVLTARAENHLYRNNEPDLLADTITRLQAFEAAGADVLYAPGLRTAADLTAVLKAVDRPLNVLALPSGASIPELESRGVRRVSIGSSMYNATAATLRAAATEMLEHGTSLYAR